MRILKSMVVDDEKTSLVSQIFNEVITEFDYPWKFNSLEFHIRDENKAVLKNGKAIIVLDYDDPFIKHQDYKGIKSLLLQQLHRLIVKEMYDPTRGFIEIILANRYMVRHGLSDYLMYIYYQRLISPQNSDLDGIIEANMGWLSFHGLDNYNEQFLKKMVKVDRIDTEDMMEKLKGDLSDSILSNEISKIYRKLKRSANN